MKTLHLLGVPHTITSRKYNACAYTQKIVKFMDMFANDPEWNIIHYGHEDSEIPDADNIKHVTVTTQSDMVATYGPEDKWKTQFFAFDVNSYIYRRFTVNAIKALTVNYEENDLVLPFFGSGVRKVCDEAWHILYHTKKISMLCVEPGIGYGSGSWCEHRIYESYAIRNAIAGPNCVSYCHNNINHRVVPNYFDKNDFVYNADKDDYFLYLGRVYVGKGLDIIQEACIRTKTKLVIYGQKDENYTLRKSPFIEYRGYADMETRKKAMAHAKGALIASQYIEPFGGVSVECLLSGTPMITSDFGAFCEIIENGKHGYRCYTIDDFCEAIENVKAGKIKSSACRKRGLDFTLDKIKPQYIKVFEDILKTV